MKEQKDYINHRSRLRERFLRGGIKGLNDYEVIELLLTFSIAQKDTKPLARALLKRFKDIPGVLNAEPDELREVKGVGEITATLIKLSHSLTELFLREGISGKYKLSSPQAVTDYLRVSMGLLKDEQFRAIYLNTQNEVMAEEIIQEGTVDQAFVYPRKLLEFGLRHKASSIILVHNHPGGLLQPSRNDIELTEKIRKSADEIGIRISDHLIITRGGYYSFHENGLL